MHRDFVLASEIHFQFPGVFDAEMVDNKHFQINTIHENTEFANSGIQRIAVVWPTEEQTCKKEDNLSCFCQSSIGKRIILVWHSFFTN